MSEIVILSVGGSLIAPDGIDVEFLKKFRELIINEVNAGKRFAIICGGGRPARVYQEAARQLASTTQTEADWLGILATRINAYLVRVLFADITHPNVIENPTEKINFTEKVIVAAGWEPGCSTDYDSILLAKNLGAKKLANLSNIDF